MTLKWGTTVESVQYNLVVKLLREPISMQLFVWLHFCYPCGEEL